MSVETPVVVHTVFGDAPGEPSSSLIPVQTCFTDASTDAADGRMQQEGPRIRLFMPHKPQHTDLDNSILQIWKWEHIISGYESSVSLPPEPPNVSRTND